MVSSRLERSKDESPHFAPDYYGSWGLLGLRKGESTLELFPLLSRADHITNDVIVCELIQYK